MTFSDTIQAVGVFASGIRYSQFDAATARVVVDLQRPVSFTIEENLEAATVTVHLSEPTYRNIFFNAETGVVELRRPQGLNMAQIVRFDQYINGQYSFILPGDFSGFFGYGDFLIRDGILRHIEIITENGTTRVIAHSNQVMAYEMTQTATSIFIRPINPREKYPFIVLLDPGHGGAYPGAVHHGVREADINLDITLMVLEILNRDGLVKAYTTRYTDITVSNLTRATMANDFADIFISIHHNAANGIATGTETLYAIHGNEPENFNSRDMAQIFQDNLSNDLNTINRGLRHRPLLQVLNSTEIPAILIEVAFMDTPSEAILIATPEFRQAAAHAIVRSIYETKALYVPLR
jgi:N-acetylmuramoyl-L-alanine amidase